MGRPLLLFKLHSTGLRPQDRAIGPALQYTVCHCLWSLSKESVQSRIGFTESLARAGPASQYTICQCTVPFGIRRYLHECIDIYGYLHPDILFQMWISIE